jgi:hypothetical protein
MNTAFALANTTVVTGDRDGSARASTTVLVDAMGKCCGLGCPCRPTGVCCGYASQHGAPHVDLRLRIAEERRSPSLRLAERVCGISGRSPVRRGFRR